MDTTVLKTALMILLASATAVSASDELPVSAPITTDSAGKSGLVAVQSVVRVMCPSTASGGTGFLHNSGRIVTAAHVVAGCTDVVVLPSIGGPIKVKETHIDSALDLALLVLESQFKAPALAIGPDRDFSIGAQVSTWGFPEGYDGRASLLSVGYLSGVGKRWVVNAAFNRGNSGGPLIDIETGSVMGVVVSKLAPIPPVVESALQALSNQRGGIMYPGRAPDGTTKNFSEAQVVSEVLTHLRAQVQLVVGYAVLLKDVHTFLESQGVKP